MFILHSLIKLQKDCAAGRFRTFDLCVMFMLLGDIRSGSFRKSTFRDDVFGGLFFVSPFSVDSSFAGFGTLESLDTGLKPVGVNFCGSGSLGEFGLLGVSPRIGARRERVGCWKTLSRMKSGLLAAYDIWETIVAKEGVTTNEKKENTSNAIIFQTLPQDVLMQVAQYTTAKKVWDSIKIKHLGADLVQKARLQTLRSELEMLRIKPNEKVSEFGGKLSSIKAKFKGLGENLEDKILVRKLLNSALKKFLSIMATIEQYQDLDKMSFEEAIGRLTTYEERIKSQDKLLMASSNNKTYGKWRGKDFNKEGKDSMKWKNNLNARRASTSQGTKDKSKLKYYECGEHGHFAKECTKWKYNKDKKEESHLIYDTDTEPTLL
nr:zinc finger, CCHC-type [Tanacetum cinerariifolium]